MILPMLFVSSILMLVFYCIDNYYYSKELSNKPTKEPVNFSIEGKFNFILLLGVVLSVILSGFYKDNLGFIYLFDNQVRISFIIRDIALFILAVISYKFTSMSLRNENGFTWFPIVEVAKLFAGIFITVIPAISILGENK